MRPALMLQVLGAAFTVSLMCCEYFYHTFLSHEQIVNAMQFTNVRNSFFILIICTYDDTHAYSLTLATRAPDGSSMLNRCDVLLMATIARRSER